MEEIYYWQCTVSLEYAEREMLNEENKLFDYQQEMLEKIITKLTKNSFTPFRKRKEYVENYSVLVQMPTGTGKTYVTASVVKWFLYFLFFLNVIKEKE